jgi:hypothetical protein
MSKIGFIAMLYAMGLALTILGGSELFVKVRFDLGSAAAAMKSSDPALLRAAKYAPQDTIRRRKLCDCERFIDSVGQVSDREAGANTCEWGRDSTEIPQKRSTSGSV